MSVRRPPSTLGPAGRKLWKTVLDAYDLEEYQLAILEAAGTAADRLAEAGRVLKAEGAFTRNRWGEARPHPALALERDSRVGLCRALRELGLELQDADASRPPRTGTGARS